MSANFTLSTYISLTSCPFILKLPFSLDTFGKNQSTSLTDFPSAMAEPLRFVVYPSTSFVVREETTATSSNFSSFIS